MRIPIILLFVLFIATAALLGESNEAAFEMKQTLEPKPLIVPAAANHSPLTSGEKFNFYLNAAVGPASIFSSAFSSGYNQAFNTIPEWGQGMEGYGKRFASSMGQKAIDKMVCSSLRILLREDPRYFYSDKHSFKSRIFHAIGETFVAHKDSGGRRPDYAYFAGVTSSVYISRQWRPESYRNAREYVTGMSVSIGAQSAKNIFLEFWPDIKKLLPGTKSSK